MLRMWVITVCLLAVDLTAGNSGGIDVCYTTHPEMLCAVMCNNAPMKYARSHIAQLITGSNTAGMELVSGETYTAGKTTGLTINIDVPSYLVVPLLLHTILLDTSWYLTGYQRDGSQSLRQQVSRYIHLR